MYFYLDGWRVTSREFLCFWRFAGAAGFFAVHVGLS